MHQASKGTRERRIKEEMTSLDPITLTKGDFHDIRDMVWDVTAEALQ